MGSCLQAMGLIYQICRVSHQNSHASNTRVCVCVGVLKDSTITQPNSRVLLRWIGPNIGDGNRPKRIKTKKGLINNIVDKAICWPTNMNNDPSNTHCLNMVFLKNKNKNNNNNQFVMESLLVYLICCWDQITHVVSISREYFMRWS